MLAHLLGGLCFAIFWQQGGWLAHDFGHNHVSCEVVLDSAASCSCTVPACSK